MTQKPKVVFILGPTGVGKTNLSVRLAKALDGEIISADSVQIYKEFDIGSAKVTQEEKQGVTHYGIDIVSPEQEFSVFDYVEYTKQKIDEISARGHLPIVVGGTGLYVKALVNDYNFADSNKDKSLREKIEKDIDENGAQAVLDTLASMRADLAKNLDKENKPRLIRAMEIALNGGERTAGESKYDFCLFALNIDRETLYERINRRAQIMIDGGLVDEVKKLYKKYGFVQPMRAIGYKEVVAYLDGQISENEMIMLIKQHSRNYAKRQLTFLRGMQNVREVNVSDLEKAYLNMLEEIKKWQMN